VRTPSPGLNASDSYTQALGSDAAMAALTADQDATGQDATRLRDRITQDRRTLMLGAMVIAPDGSPITWGHRKVWPPAAVELCPCAWCTGKEDPPPSHPTRTERRQTAQWSRRRRARHA